MPKLVIDGTEIEVDNGVTLLQACEEAGREIPRFCYHERLSVAGNCRMCLVEVKGMPKLLASCATSVNDLRPGPEGQPPEIRTNSQAVKKMREGVMEFLLINHPLDCPICDQGGECDLQDQAVAYGVDASRYSENKRAVNDKYLGPVVKMEMTRCIQCTRCVRFITEVAGTEELGAIGRGSDLEITPYLDNVLTSELQGNLIDLCPVGALTSRPFEFTARPWEMRKTESVDVMDAVGSNIRIDTRGRQVMRIMPRNNDAVNEEWLSDKSRFIWDGLAARRLDRPYVKVGGKLKECTWDEAFAAIEARIKDATSTSIAAIAGDLAGAEEMFALKDLMSRLAVQNIDCRQDGAALDPGLGRASYLFNSTIDGIEEADSLMIIGSNPRIEAPVLNSRIRKRWRMGDFPIGLIGEQADLTYGYSYLGAGPESLLALPEDKTSSSTSKRPMVIVGQGALMRPDGAAILSAAAKFALARGVVTQDWNGFNVLHTAAARVAGLDLGFVPGKGGRDVAGILKGAQEGEIGTVFLLGADEIDMDKLGSAFVIYQGSHGDAGAHRADVILPGAAYTEKNATWANTEGRAQSSRPAVFPPGDAREDWTIIRALSDILGHRLRYDTLDQLRSAMYQMAPALGVLDEIDASDVAAITALAKVGGLVSGEPFQAAVGDFYMTNPIARASKVMAELSDARNARNQGEATGTDG